MPDFELPDDSTFTSEVSPILAGVFRDAAEDVIDRFNLPVSFDYVFPAAHDYAEERGAEMIGKKLVDGELIDNPNAKWVIDDYTRERVNELTQEAISEGWGPEELAEHIDESGVFGEARAEMIARTEVAIAQSRGKVRTYREADIEKVMVLDGDYDSECQDANNSVWTVDEAEENPVEHPNCERDFRPLTREERAEEDDEEGDEE